MDLYHFYQTILEADILKIIISNLEHPVIHKYYILNKFKNLIKFY
jgi:hypothetical protein